MQYPKGVINLYLELPVITYEAQIHLKHAQYKTQYKPVQCHTQSKSRQSHNLRCHKSPSLKFLTPCKGPHYFAMPLSQNGITKLALIPFVMIQGKC